MGAKACGQTDRKQMSALIDLVFHSDGRFTMPILTYPGAPLVGATVRQMVTDPKALFEVLAALHRKFATPVVLTAMDLSVESEAFGCEVAFADHEVPTVVGRLVTTRGAAERLAVPNRARDGPACIWRPRGGCGPCLAARWCSRRCWVRSLWPRGCTA